MKDIEMKVYEQDRGIIEQLSSFTEEEFKLVEKDVANYFEENRATQFFMLLSNDINYFTIFENCDCGKVMFNPEQMSQTFLEFLTEDSFLRSLGELKVLKRINNDEVLEIWIGETYFLLFEADHLFVGI